MKKSRRFSGYIGAIILLLIVQIPVVPTDAVFQRRYPIPVYKRFNNEIDPLHHEAVPNRDFRRIRAMADELLKSGEQIVELGVPEFPVPNRRRFATARQRFKKALAKFKTDAARQSDEKLTKSFTKLYDSFQELADLVPSVYWGEAPTLFLDCPSDVLAGNRISLNANIVTEDEMTFKWLVKAGKILSGEGTKTIILDTTGLAGQTIAVYVEGSDEYGHTIAASCEVHVR
jgi:hypothetical protein